jgi:hypothetical protein
VAQIAAKPEQALRQAASKAQDVLYGATPTRSELNGRFKTERKKQCAVFGAVTLQLARGEFSVPFLCQREKNG